MWVQKVHIIRYKCNSKNLKNNFLTGTIKRLDTKGMYAYTVRGNGESKNLNNKKHRHQPLPPISDPTYSYYVSSMNMCIQYILFVFLKHSETMLLIETP